MVLIITWLFNDMIKPLNKKIQFVKLKDEMTTIANIPYRVKSFGDKESVIIVDKKATIIDNDKLHQDMDCYKADQQVKVKQFKR